MWTLCRHLETKCDPSRSNAIDDFIEKLHFVTVTLVMRGYNGKTNRVLTHMVSTYGPWYYMEMGVGLFLQTRSIIGPWAWSIKAWGNLDLLGHGNKDWLGWAQV